MSGNLGARGMSESTWTQRFVWLSSAWLGFAWREPGRGEAPTS